MRTADPLVSANIYCSGRLDEVLVRGLVPFRRRLREELPPAGDTAPFFWLLRYARGGEHWKVRVHALPEQRERIETLLREEIERCLAEIGPRPEGEARRTRPDALPIDAEDAEGDEAPDRSVRRTRYGRSHISLGGEPFLSRDDYRALMAACLAAGTSQLLDAVESHGAFTAAGPRLRQLLKGLVTGIAALGQAAPTAAAYLAYHRDWSIRFPLLQSQDPAAQEKVRETLERLDRQAVKMAPLEEALQDMVRQGWTGTPAAPADSPWGTSLPDLQAYLAGFRDDFRLDPFAPDVAFPPLFKVFHGLANQLGLTAQDEAFAHHLLLRAAADDLEPYRQIALTPP